ncbi:MAG: serine hydrolase [Holophagales bacterium]|nr:serine hydrolase [Holophagales bacterium]
MRRATPWISTLVLALVVALPALASERVPGERWLRYADPADAGFDAAKLEAARQTWSSIPSAAFLVVADGAVVAAWGETERRFMCHSVRKSFLSALYGVYWDRGEIELNKTLADLGIDDTPDPLMPGERQARVLDLLKARSGVFHPAAYAGRTDSRPRGSEGPGRYFAYNNWDFNTLATILEEETGARVFEAFDEHFARPLGMEDWRLSDGYYHFERDKSRFPAYPFRLSARDAARFGLLFAREGVWGDSRILSKNWVRRSSALYSIDNDVWGYGFMWWIAREPRFERYGMYSALGVGNQMIAVLPDIDVVIVNRANTYVGAGTPQGALLDLVEQVLAARTGAPAAEPRLEPMPGAPADPFETAVTAETLAPLVGRWPWPPLPLGMPAEGEVRLAAAEGHLTLTAPIGSTFAVYLQPDGTLREEDSRERYVVVPDEAGEVAGLADAETIAGAAVVAAARGEAARADTLFSLAGDDDRTSVGVGRVVVEWLGERGQRALELARGLAEKTSAREIERRINGVGYALLGEEEKQAAVRVFELNTELFPEASNTWDSLGEAHVALGHVAEAIRSYERSLKLDPESRSAREALEKLRAGG